MVEFKAVHSFRDVRYKEIESMILSAENLSYSYGDRLLFENITFNVEEGDKYGIIGVNGTGKSTLLRRQKHAFAYAGQP